jgi:hypothetical protein
MNSAQLVRWLPVAISLQSPPHLPVEPVGDTSFFLDWIGLRENLQETIDFPIKYGAFLQIFP